MCKGNCRVVMTLSLGNASRRLHMGSRTWKRLYSPNTWSIWSRQCNPAEMFPRQPSLSSKVLVRTVYPEDSYFSEPVRTVRVLWAVQLEVST